MYLLKLRNDDVNLLKPLNILCGTSSSEKKFDKLQNAELKTICDEVPLLSLSALSLVLIVFMLDFLDCGTNTKGELAVVFILSSSTITVTRCAVDVGSWYHRLHLWSMQSEQGIKLVAEPINLLQGMQDISRTLVGKHCNRVI